MKKYRVTSDQINVWSEVTFRTGDIVEIVPPDLGNVVFARHAGTTETPRVVNMACLEEEREYDQ